MSQNIQSNYLVPNRKIYLELVFSNIIDGVTSNEAEEVILPYCMNNTALSSEILSDTQNLLQYVEYFYDFHNGNYTYTCFLDISY